MDSSVALREDRDAVVEPDSEKKLLAVVSTSVLSRLADSPVTLSSPSVCTSSSISTSFASGDSSSPPRSQGRQPHCRPERVRQLYLAHCHSELAHSRCRYQHRSLYHRRDSRRRLLHQCRLRHALRCCCCQQQEPRTRSSQLQWSAATPNRPSSWHLPTLFVRLASTGEWRLAGSPSLVH